MIILLEKGCYKNKIKNIYFKHTINDIYIEVHRTINTIYTIIQEIGKNITDASYSYLKNGMHFCTIQLNNFEL